MPKQRKRAFALALAASLAALTAASAPATARVALHFAVPQQDSPYHNDYLSPQLTLKKKKMPLVLPDAGATIYVSPDAEGRVYVEPTYDGDFTPQYRYLDTVGEFYQLLSSDQLVLYVRTDQAERVTKSVTYGQYPAGVYGVGLEKTPGVERQQGSGASASVSYTPGELRAPEEAYLLARTGYYVKPLKGKSATVVISRDEAGQDAVKTLRFSGQAIVDAEDGQYVTVKDALMYDAVLAPSGILKRYIEKNPDFFAPPASYLPGDGIPE